MKILFFAPHAAVWVHAFPEALVAEALKQNGHEVVYVTCGGELDEYCIAMSAQGLSYQAPEKEKRKICQICHQNKTLLRKEFGFKGYDLKEKLRPEDYARIEEILNNVNLENFLDLTIDGINVGRIALYQILLHLKKQNTNFNPGEWKRYRSELKNSLMAFFACKRIIKDESPDRIVIYNILYSVNNICHQLAKMQNIPGYFLHAGGNLSNRLETVFIGKENPFEVFRVMLLRWEELKFQPCRKEMLEKITNHFLELLRGRSVFAYSHTKSKSVVDIRKKFGMTKTQKLLVAALSSSDEIIAAEAININFNNENSIFAGQIDWLQNLIEYFRSRPELFLVIRAHPRQFPNKRDGIKSEEAVVLERELEHLPLNVKVNWPTDQLSFYELAEEADVFLTSWSGVGKEMALLGIPVVLSFPQYVFYPPDLNFTAATKSEYFEKIEKALSDGWNFEIIRTAYRWSVLEYERSVIDISESFKMNETQNGNLVGRTIRWGMRTIFNYRYQEVRDCRKRASQLRSRKVICELIENNWDTIMDFRGEDSFPAPTLEDETRFLKQEISRILKALSGGDNERITRTPLQEKLYKAIQDSPKWDGVDQ